MSWPLAVLGSWLVPCQVPPAEPSDAPIQPSVALPDGVAAPVLDGRLDDEAWSLALPFPELRQVVPVAGARPSQRTEVRIVHTSRALYVALACYDTNPRGIRATQAERDANLDPDDRVEILLDTFYDRRNAFWFQIGAAGSLGDALLARNGSSFNKDWDGIWDGRARVTEQGWFAELEIPFATLDFPQDVTRFGFNLRRFVRRDNEEARLAAADPALRFFDPSFAGAITGLDGVDRPIGLDIVPFGTLSYDRDVESGDEDLLGDAGLDLYWRITPNTKLSLSYNTDFAETEVDDRQVNLTRFSLFFPEKRNFFLEDSSAFVFGPGGSNEVLPFFSRTIGLSEDGEPVPILAAAKLVSRSDQGSVGVLGALTDDFESLAGQELAVVRPSLAIGARSDVGLIATAGDPAHDLHSQTLGVDMNLRTAELLGNRNARLSAYWIATEEDFDSNEPEAETSGSAWLVEAEYPNDEVQAELTYQEVEAGFDPALGFVRRTDIRRFDGSFFYRPRLYTDIRRLVFGASATRITDRDDNPQSERVRAVPLGVDLETGDELEVFVIYEREVLSEPFELADEVTIPTGDYDYVRYGAGVSTQDGRAADVSLELETGGFFDGIRHDADLRFSWRPSSLIELGLDYSYRILDVVNESFDVHVAGLGLDFSFTPMVSWSNLFQYDDVSTDLGWNSRVRWIVKPGTEFYFVINQSWLATAGDFTRLDGQAIAKLVWTLRF